MSLFLSLQGSMAAGKTTAARYLEACPVPGNAPSHERPSSENSRFPYASKSSCADCPSIL